MGLGRDDLVLSVGTHLVTPFLDRLAPARAAGFTGVSVYPYEVQALRSQGVDDAELRARVADAGLEVGELDAVTAWLPGNEPPESLGEPMASMLRANTADLLCPMAEAVGARSVTLVEFYGNRPTPDVATEAFAAVCDRAAEHGVLVHLEFLPWGGIPDLASAWPIVRDADRRNGGLLVDNWHFARSGSTWEELAALPGDRVFYVQLSDAPLQAEDDLSEETQHRRLAPGEGELDVARFVAAVDRLGVTCPIGAEVFSDELTTQPIGEVAQRVGDATRRVLAAAGR